MAKEKSKGDFKADRNPEKNQRSKTRNEERKLARRDAAEKRREKWNSLSTEQKIEALNKRPGKSRKQLAKLKMQLKSELLAKEEVSS